MLVNSDFSQPAYLNTSDIAWETSPMAGVTRRRLDRLDTDDRQVTTLVEYAPNSHFSAHVHHGGEELLVLEGVFEDDYGDWPAGSYVRNPPGSKHTPGSRDGCLLFVKLGQFDPRDTRFVHAHIDHLETIPHRGHNGRSVASLYSDAQESVRLERWNANTCMPLTPIGGMEILILEGTLTLTDTTSEADVTSANHATSELNANTTVSTQHPSMRFQQHDWLRLPDGYSVNLMTGAADVRLWTKTGHLPFRESLNHSSSGTVITDG